MEYNYNLGKYVLKTKSTSPCNAHLPLKATIYCSDKPARLSNVILNSYHMVLLLYIYKKNALTNSAVEEERK